MLLSEKELEEFTLAVKENRTNIKEIKRTLGFSYFVITTEMEIARKIGEEKETAEDKVDELEDTVIELEQKIEELKDQQSKEYDTGYDAGYTQGYEDGQRVLCKNGYKEGYKEGYERGKNE